MGGIRLMVLSQKGAWRIKVGEALSPPFRSQSDAVRSAMRRATKISRDGFDAEVVMKVMTCQFGPNGFFKTVPTPRDIDWE
jgi:hypothetical protein